MSRKDRKMIKDPENDSSSKTEGFSVDGVKYSVPVYDTVNATLAAKSFQIRGPTTGKLGKHKI